MELKYLLEKIAHKSVKTGSKVNFILKFSSPTPLRMLLATIHPQYVQTKQVPNKLVKCNPSPPTLPPDPHDLASVHFKNPIVLPPPRLSTLKSCFRSKLERPDRRPTRHTAWLTDILHSTSQPACLGQEQRSTGSHFISSPSAHYLRAGSNVCPLELPGAATGATGFGDGPGQGRPIMT